MTRAPIFQNGWECRRSSAPIFYVAYTESDPYPNGWRQMLNLRVPCHLIAFVHCSGRCLFCKVESTAMEYKFAWAKHQISSMFGVSNKTAVVDSSVSMFFLHIGYPQFWDVWGCCSKMETPNLLPKLDQEELLWCLMAICLSILRQVMTTPFACPATEGVSGCHLFRFHGLQMENL